MRTRFVVAGCLAVSLLLACRDSTGPAVRPTHPAGNVADAITSSIGSLYAVQVAPAGDIVATSSGDNELVHIDADIRTRTFIGVAISPQDVVLNHAGTLAFVSCAVEGVIDFIDLTKNRFLAALRLPATLANRVVLSPDEARLFVTTHFGDVFAVNARSRTMATSTRLSGSPQGIAVAHSGRDLFVGASQGVVWRLDPSSLATAARASVECIVADLAISMDDAELYAACEEGKVLVLDAKTLAVRASVSVNGSGYFALAVTPDNAQVFVSSSAGGVSIIDREQRIVVRRIALSGFPRRMAFSASGDKAYVANSNGRLDVIE
jgi:DNA-binding beta-propeller fold protein YncE